jgi:hypothetical protein
MPQSSTPWDSYDRSLQPERDRLVARLTPFFEEKEPRVLGLFLIHFCSQGVGMTEPVEGWIRRAGERTRAAGFAELGTALVHHAAHEAGHHEMMIRDTHRLVAWWNDFHQPKLSAATFLERPWSLGVERYRQLHEATIAGDAPYGQIAIEYEIERVSVDCGPKLFGYVASVLGKSVMGCLSFLTEHVAIDVGHTQYNRRALSDFLIRAPHTRDALVRAGTAALDTYAGFLEDCVAGARADAYKLSTPTA